MPIDHVVLPSLSWVGISLYFHQEGCHNCSSNISVVFVQNYISTRDTLNNL